MENKVILNILPSVVGDAAIIIPNAPEDKFDWKHLISTTEVRSLVDLTATDWIQCQPETEGRFSLVGILAMEKGDSLGVRIDLEGSSIPTLMNNLPSANYLEREIFDLFGVTFAGHIDLRRILTDYGFIGHPLRKDFPMIGYHEIFYSPSEKGVIQRPVMMNQEFRLLKPTSQWSEKGEN